MQINTDCCNSCQRQIEELAMENNELKTKLQAEEEKRRILSEKSVVRELWLLHVLCSISKRSLLYVHQQLMLKTFMFGLFSYYGQLSMFVDHPEFQLYILSHKNA